MWKRLATVGLSIVTLIGCAGSETLNTTPSAEQQQAMQTPDGTVRLYYELVQREAYTEVAPLLTPTFRDQLVREGNGRLSGFYTAGARYSGALDGYTIDGQRPLGPALAEVDVTVRFANRTQRGDPSTVTLEKTEAGWQIAGLRNRS